MNEQKVAIGQRWRWRYGDHSDLLLEVVEIIGTQCTCKTIHIYKSVYNDKVGNNYYKAINSFSISTKSNFSWWEYLEGQDKPF